MFNKILYIIFAFTSFVHCLNFEDTSLEALGNLLIMDGIRSRAFEVTLGVPGSIDSSANVIQTYDGGYVVVGYANASWGTPIHPYTGGDDLVIVKLNIDGTYRWHTFLGMSNNEFPFDLVQSRDGGLIIAADARGNFGSPHVAFAGAIDALLLKLDAGGNLLWHTYLGGVGNEQGFGVHETRNGDILLVGGADATFGSPLVAHPGGTAAYLARFNSAGILNWLTFAGGGGQNTGRQVYEDAAGDIYMSGDSSSSFGSPVHAYGGGADFMLLKFNGSGARLLTSFAGGALDDNLRNMTALPDGDLALTGPARSSFGSPTNPYVAGDEILVTRFDPMGNLLWNTYMGGTGTDIGGGVIPTWDGGVVIGGYGTSSYGLPLYPYQGGDDVVIARFDTTGALLWHTYSGTGLGDACFDIASAADGGYICVGTTVDSGGQSDIYLVKLHADGSR